MDELGTIVLAVTLAVFAGTWWLLGWPWRKLNEWLDSFFPFEV